MWPVCAYVIGENNHLVHFLQHKQCLFMFVPMTMHVCVCHTHTVRETSQSPQSSAPTFTRSQSPDYGFPAPATAHQAPLYQGSLHTRSLSGLPFTTPNCSWLSNHLTCVYLPSSSPRVSSDPPVLFPFIILPTALALLQTKGHSRYRAYIQRTICCISPYLTFLASILLCCSINLLVTHLPVCVWPVLWRIHRHTFTKYIQ